MIYVLNKEGNPIMPTKRHGKVRHLLKEGKAEIICYTPFTIKLLYDSTSYTQEVSLGVDAGSKTIGLSATTNTKELYASEVELRNDITKLLATRSENRKARRNRKTRYRKARFKNRASAKKKGWLAPSVRHKIDCHVTVIDKVAKILPISQIVIEVASFDIQKIKNPNIEGKGYQGGEQLNFWNVREYVLFRDNHTCQCCKGKSKDKVLNVHHIESRKTGGDAPNNLITLCETCHSGYHKGTISIPKSIKRGMKFNDASFMGIMRWAFYNRVKEIYEKTGVKVSRTYGYTTKNMRIENGLAKEHFIDARCISGNPNAEPLGKVYYQKKVRRHNRQIHKSTILKGGYRKRNQAEYLVKGFRLFDKVLYDGEEYFVFGRRKSGFFDIRKLSGEKVNNRNINYKKLQFKEARKGYLIEEKEVGLS